MKNSILFLLVGFIFSTSCLSQKKADSPKYKKGVTKISTTYTNSDEGFEITYNENSQITTVLRTDGVSLVFSYNNTGLVAKQDFYFEDAVFKFNKYNWFTDSVQITKYIVNNNETIEDALETYNYNVNKEITNITRYKKDSLGQWQKRGSKYEFDWENGNLKAYRTYVPSEFNENDSTKTMGTQEASMTELEEISNLFIHEGYTLFYEATFSYDDKNNPYMDNSISNLILPSNSNLSKNNPTSITKKYNSGEVLQLDYKYEYNDKDFPTVANVIVTSNMEGLENTEFKTEFNY